MSIKDKVRAWLGTDTNATPQDIHHLRIAIQDLCNSHEKLQRLVMVGVNASARVIAKAEPLFGPGEDSPESKAASDKINKQVLKRLYGEHDALASKGLLR